MTKVLLSLVVLAGAAGTACATVTARTPPDRPTLEVPAPPTKVIDPPPQPEPAPPEPVPDLPVATPTNSRPARPPTRDTARTDPKPEAPAVEAAPAPVTPVTPPPQLRASGTADGAEASKQVQVILDRANKTLSSIDYRRLNKAQQDQYRTAQNLIKQCEDHLKASDYDIAKNLADKADRIAKELGGK